MTLSNSSFRRFSPRWVLLLCAALLLWNLDYATFWNPDEARYASSSLEMARGFEGQNPDWIVPHLNTIARLNKPPLVYWLAATFYQLFGAHEWSGRLGSAFFAILTMLLLWQMARKTWNERVGLFAAMIWTTSLLPFILARTLNTDMLLCGAITLAMFGLWRALEPSKNNESKSQILPIKNSNNQSSQDEISNIEYSILSTKARVDWPGFLIAALGMGLALLAKGPVGAVLPLAISFCSLLATRRWNVLRDGRIWLGVFLALVLAIALVAPWVLAVQARYPNFLKQFLLGENVARFTGGKEFHAQPFYYFVPVVLLGLLPWTPLLIPAVVYRPRDASTLRNRTLIFAWLWAGFVFFLFSASKTKLFSYVLPAFPALAILCAVALQRIIENRVLETRKIRLVVPVTVALLNVLLLAGCAYGALSGTVLPQNAGAPYLLAIAVVLLGGTFWLWREWPQNAARAVFAHFATSGALFVALLAFAGKVALYADSSTMIAQLAPHLTRDEKLVQMTFQPTSIFYTARPIVVIGFDNSSGLSDDELRHSSLFPTLETAPDKAPDNSQKRLEARVMANFLNAPARVFVLLKRREFAYFMKHARAALKTPTFVIARNNDFLILSNRPTPAGYDFQRVAPKALNREIAKP